MKKVSEKSERMKDFIKSNKGKNCIYITTCVVLLLIAFFYMNSLKLQRYTETEVPPCEGMVPLNVCEQVEQPITAGDTFSGVGIQFYTREYICTDDVIVEIIDSATNTVLGNYERNAKDFSDDEMQYFMLDEIKTGNPGKEYFVRISIVEGDSEKHVSLGVSTQENEWVSKPYVAEYNGEQLKLEMTVCGQLIDNRHIAGVLLIMILLFIGGYFLTQKQLKEETILLALLATIGFAYFIAIPMLQVPDEKGHYYRSFEVSRGDLLTPQGKIGGGYSRLPENLIPEKLEDLNHIDYKAIRESKDEVIDKDVLENYDNSTQALYAPPSYLPQAIGCFIGRLLSDETVTIFYMGRLMNFISCSALVYLAIKMIPFGKRFLLLMICMPMYLQQMVSLSTDAFINAMAFVLIAWILKLLDQEQKCSKGQLTGLMIVCFLVALCKVVYLPLCFLVLLIPSEKIGSTLKKGRLYKAICVIVSTILNFGWLAIGFGYMIQFRPGVDTAAQIEFILTHPFKYLGVIGATFAEKIIDWLGTMVGAKMCILNVYTCLTLVVLYILVLFFEMAVTSQEEHNFLSGKMRALHVGLFFVVFLITLTSLYAQWTAYRNPQIEGFQGRYFIPILPLLMCGLKGKRLNVSGNELLRYELAMIFCINVTTLFCVATYYL